MASPVADIFSAVAAANRGDVRRRGNVVHVESGRTLIVAGDIHGNRANLDCILRYAALRERGDRVLVLQEIRALGYTGGYTVLKELVRSIRPRSVRRHCSPAFAPPANPSVNSAWSCSAPAPPASASAA